MGIESGGAYIYQCVKVKYRVAAAKGNTLGVSAELETTVRS